MRDFMKKILVAIPVQEYIEVETFKSLWDLNVPEGYEIDLVIEKSDNIDQIRNLIAHWATKYDYLFSVDSDIVVPSDALTKMLAADKDIISGLYIQRIPNTHTVEVYMDNNQGGFVHIPYQQLKPINGVVEVAACGMGCALIKSTVFKSIDYPHFVYRSALNHDHTFSEDVFFCQRARQHGFRIWADTTIQCDHIGQTRYKVEQ